MIKDLNIKAQKVYNQVALAKYSKCIIAFNSCNTLSFNVYSLVMSEVLYTLLDDRNKTVNPQVNYRSV